MLHEFHSLSFMLYISSTLVPFSWNHRYFLSHFPSPTHWLLVPLAAVDGCADWDCARVCSWPWWWVCPRKLPWIPAIIRQYLKHFFWKPIILDIYVIFFFWGGGENIFRFLSSTFNFFVGWRLREVAISLSKSYHSLIQIWFVEVNQSVSAIEL